jgi:hypothetical protein
MIPYFFFEQINRSCFIFRLHEKTEENYKNILLIMCASCKDRTKSLGVMKQNYFECDVTYLRSSWFSLVTSASNSVAWANGFTTVPWNKTADLETGDSLKWQLRAYNPSSVESKGPPGFVPSSRRLPQSIAHHLQPLPLQRGIQIGDRTLRNFLHYFLNSPLDTRDC